MKKLFALILILATLGTLAACGNSSDVPEGMQPVRCGEDVGYYFYAPEEWTVANLSDISAAYASNVDSSSVTYTETAMPSGTVAEYFAESLKEFPEAPKVTVNGEEVTFGNADQAIKYVYEYSYAEHNFRTMQIFVKYGDRFGIFTYTSMLEIKSDPDKVQYDYYLDKIENVIDNFKFVNKSGTPEKPEYTVEDGWKMISDKRTAKFSLYVPEQFEVEYSSGIVLAKLPDGSNISMSRATSTGMSVADYWNNRKTELDAIVDDITVVMQTADGGEEKEYANVTFGNAKSAAAYEYTYTYNGTVYHVYQVFAVTSFNGFAFTYTATNENYASHIDTVKDIIAKVEL